MANEFAFSNVQVLDVVFANGEEVYTVFNAEGNLVLAPHRGSNGDFTMTATQMMAIADEYNVSYDDVNIMCCYPAVCQDNGRAWDSNGWVIGTVFGDWNDESTFIIFQGETQIVDAADLQPNVSYSMEYVSRAEYDARKARGEALA